MDRMPDPEEPLPEDSSDDSEDTEEPSGDAIIPIDEVPIDEGGKSEASKRKTRSKLVYTLEFEQLLKENGDHAQVYSILHQMAHLKYKRLFDRANIPLIIIVAMIGFITGIGIDYPHIGIILGGGSVAVSIAKSILAYLKWSEQSENHRICSLQFGQIATEIKTELSLQKDQRQPPKIMLDIIKVKLKNLMEVAHILDPDVIRAFQDKYQLSDQKIKEYKTSGVTFPPIFSDLPGIKILGASTEEDRMKQLKKSLDDRKEELEADLQRKRMEHEHERNELMEDVTHNNELKKIQNGALRLGAAPAGPPTSVMVPIMQEIRSTVPLRSMAPTVSRKTVALSSNKLYRQDSVEPSPSLPAPE